MNNTESDNTEGWNELNADDVVMSDIQKFSKRLKEDPEFRQRFENKRKRVNCIVCLIRIFCCPCIAIWNLSKI